MNNKERSEPRKRRGRPPKTEQYITVSVRLKPEQVEALDEIVKRRRRHPSFRDRSTIIRSLIDESLANTQS